MSKNFEAKKVVVSEIEEKIEKAESIVIVEYLEGPNAFVFSNGDPVSAPKLVKEFITAAEKDKKTSPLTIKAGIMDGAVQSVEEVKALADILPREQLIAKIMGCLNSQATALAYVIQAIADKKAEAGEQ